MVEIEQQIFGATSHRTQPVPDQLCREIGRDGLPQPRLAHMYCAETRAFQMRRDAAGGGLDFG